MARYISIWASVAIAFALVGFLVGSWFPLMPAPLLAVTLFFCPSQVFFVATTACEPFDSCSLETLAWVVAANVLLHSALAFVSWLTRERWRTVRLGIFSAVAATSAWWVTQWV